MKTLPKRYSVEINNDREVLKKVLERFEEMGVKWCSGEKPTEFKPNNVNNIGVNFYNLGTITYGLNSLDFKIYTNNIVSASEFLELTKQYSIT